MSNKTEEQKSLSDSSDDNIHLNELLNYEIQYIEDND